MFIMDKTKLLDENDLVRVEESEIDKIIDDVEDSLEYFEEDINTKNIANALSI